MNKRPEVRFKHKTKTNWCLGLIIKSGNVWRNTTSHQGQRNKEFASCNEKKKKKSSFNSLKCDTRALNVRDGQNYCGANQYKRNQATDCLNSRILWSPSAEQNEEVNCLEGGKLIMVVGLLPCIQKIGWCVN